MSRGAYPKARPRTKRPATPPGAQAPPNRFWGQRVRIVPRPTIVKKPWGREVVFANTGLYVGKVLQIEPGKRLSYQWHPNKFESLFIVDGIALLEYGNTECIRGTQHLTGGDTIEVPPGENACHRITALGDRLLVIFEVSTPEGRGTVRVFDDYGREGG